MLTRSKQPKACRITVWEDVARDYLEIHGKLDLSAQDVIIHALHTSGVQSENLRPLSCLLLDRQVIVVGNIDPANQVWLFDPCGRTLRRIRVS